jgi:hypothetical protein
VAAAADFAKVLYSEMGRSENGVTQWRLSEILVPDKVPRLSAMALNPSSDQVAVGFDDGRLAIINTSAAEWVCTANLDDVGSPIDSVSWDKLGKRIAVASYRGLMVFNSAGKEFIKSADSTLPTTANDPSVAGQAIWRLLLRDSVSRQLTNEFKDVVKKARKAADSWDEDWTVLQTAGAAIYREAQSLPGLSPQAAEYRSAANYLVKAYGEDTRNRPFAGVFLALTLAASGDEKQARKILDAVTEAQRNLLIDPDLANLLKEAKQKIK